MPQRLRRLGSASAAVSAGAIVLLLSAAPADAAAAPQTCRKGTDPASTIENWKCNLGNLREAILPTSPSPTPTKPAAPAPKKTTQTKSHKAPEKPRKPAARQEAPPPSTMTGTQSLRRLPGDVPSLPQADLPAPQIAADPNAYQVAGTRTRLVSPTAASEETDGTRLPWAAAAAGAAGAVAALHFSVAGRILRRRAAG